MSTQLTMGAVMTASPLTIEITDSVAQAQKILTEKGIRHLPVTSNGKFVSVLSDRDINLALVANQGLEQAADLTVEDVCTLHTYTADVNDLLADVVSDMAEKHIGSVMVLNSGDLAGIFTATDACRLLGKVLTENA